MAQIIYDSALHSPRPLRPTAMYSQYQAPPTPPYDSLLSTFSPPSPPSHPTTCSNVLMGRSSYQLFVSTHSRVIRIFNLPKDASAHLSALFYPNTPHAPVTMWTLREEYGGTPPAEEDSVWAVFKTHDQAAAALGLAGGSVSVATALEQDLEPFRKLRKLDLTRHSYTPAMPPTKPASPVSPQVTDLSRVLRPSHSVSDLRTGSQEYPYTLSSNPPNPRNTFRQGDWICASMTCAAHNFMRNLVCIGCGSPRPASSPSGPANASRSNTANPSRTGPIPGAPLSLSFPWPRLASSPRFAGVPSSEFINGISEHGYPSSSDYMRPSSDHTQHRRPSSDMTDVPPYSDSPPRSLPKMASLPSFTSGRSFSPTTQPSFPSPQHSFPSPQHSFSPTAYSSSSPTHPSPSSYLGLGKLPSLTPSSLPSLLTPSGRFLATTGRVQNVNPSPTGVPCVMYWPDNEPLPDASQIRPPGAGATGQVPPILNTGNKGPIEQQPGDWVCGVCDYLNWRRRKVCQTCYPYAEGNTDGVSASVQAERIAVLAQVLAVTHSQSQVHAQAEAHASHLSQAQSHSHSIPTPPNDMLDNVYRTSASGEVCLYRSPGSEYAYPSQDSSLLHQSSPPPYTSSSPESEYFPPSATSFRRPSSPRLRSEPYFTHLPSFLHDEDEYALPSPATPPLSTSSGASSPQSVQGPALHGHSHPVSPASIKHHLETPHKQHSELPPATQKHNPNSPSSLVFPGGSSIWALRKEEVDK